MTTSTTPSYTHHTDIGFVYRTSPANGIQDEIEDERALRAADDIETGVPPAGDYETTAIMHTYIHAEQSHFSDGERETRGGGVRQWRRHRDRGQDRECTEGCDRDQDGHAACRRLRERRHHYPHHPQHHPHERDQSIHQTCGHIRRGGETAATSSAAEPQGGQVGGAAAMSSAAAPNALGDGVAWLGGSDEERRRSDCLG